MATYEENQIINQTRPLVFAHITGHNAARERVDFVKGFNSPDEVKTKMREASKGGCIYTATLNDGTKI